MILLLSVLVGPFLIILGWPECRCLSRIKVPLFWFHLLTLFGLNVSERILVWNVRGLNSSARQDSVRTLIDASRVDIVYIQETKKYVVTQQFSLLLDQSFLTSSSDHLLVLVEAFLLLGDTI